MFKYFLIFVVIYFLFRRFFSAAIKVSRQQKGKRNNPRSKNNKRSNTKSSEPFLKSDGIEEIDFEDLDEK